MASRPRGSARPRVTRVFVRLAVVVGLAGILLLAGSGAAEAHPLGNFTINLYDGLIVRTDGIDVDYVVDMAEIPAFEERQTIDVNGDGTLDPTETAAYVDQTCGRLADGLTVAVAGRALPVRPAGDGTVSFPPGAGGLSTMRLECPMHGKAQLREGQQIAYRDGNFAGTDRMARGDRRRRPARGARQRRAGTKPERASHVVSREPPAVAARPTNGLLPGGRPDVDLGRTGVRGIGADHSWLRRHVDAPRSPASSRREEARPCSGRSLSPRRSRSAACTRSARGTGRR